MPVMKAGVPLVGQALGKLTADANVLALPVTAENADMVVLLLPPTMARNSSRLLHRTTARVRMGPDRPDRPVEKWFGRNS
jgi:hypothetical protein